MYLNHPLPLLLPLILVNANPPINDILTSTSVFTSTISTLQDLNLTSCCLNHTILNLEYNQTALPSPSPNLTVQYVALGRGIQNYTCTNDTANPTSIGAMATLFDASCIVSADQKLFHRLPNILQSVPVETLDFFASFASLAGPDSAILGEHYFTASAQPFFDLRLSGNEDWAAAKKVASVASPMASMDVPWLKLASVDGVGIKEVYRVYTAGGASPATCEGMTKAFSVDYAAEYWFYG
ncbi:hypothetical protein BO78DRAFT_428105 [Aspergillus sclerotiicarbonarius CBS 121057]|uniref:Malate dehydrogenase n=1 Tax=Aspergillus sclerotiicarbonarius (strain CBS 121057 / IBT 28362) TaxID=1448318 RepID=A0A319EFZ6_ASPSB|nr:hypothetical protein BO78DRAFT_428105 [Aspergillus sclerotiicarbonarius CBS 121057]